MSATTTTTTTFRSNLNSVSIRFRTGAAEVKHSITTCLQRWRQKLPLKKRNKHQQQQQTSSSSAHKEECKCHCQNNSTFVQQRSIYWKQFQTIQQQLVSVKNLTLRKDNKKGPRKYGRKVEIVAKLLSTTLIATTEKSCQENSSFEEHLEFIKNSTKTLSSTTISSSTDAMTITDLTYLEIRDEHPDLDKEIRSILNARAQKGATISQIRDDYRKLTGLVFPVYDDVTDFLLTIPYVTAQCTEKGTRVFNINPMDKTKHIHDMVVNQKISEEPPVHRTTYNRNYYRERPRSQNYHPYNWRHNCDNWRSNTNNRQLRTTKPTYAEHNMIMDKERQRQTSKDVSATDNNLSRDDSEGFVENNIYYADNCNYLLSRICNQQQPMQQQHLQKTAVSHMIINPNNDNIEQPTQSTNTARVSNNYNANVPSSSYENNVQHHRNQQILNINTNNVAKQQEPRSYLPPFKSGMPRSSRSSSPTATSVSAYTDSDYEAHLLDFLLLGDDLILYMARMELRCKFKKDRRILQSGLCVSGQTIGGAIKRIRALSDNRRSVILNIGSVDIMQGKQLIQIEHDFRGLIMLMLKKGLKPILTTLAPLANYSHDNEIKGMLERFNEFVKREGQKRNLIVIDIWKCLVNEKGQVLFDCYQNEPRTVTGTSESYLFWNKIGRQRVLQLIESKLEY